MLRARLASVSTPSKQGRASSAARAFRLEDPHVSEADCNRVRRLSA
jgi:hypothetical protein